MRLVVVTALTMVAFAANSVLARMALGAGAIDAASYTFVRVVSGAVVLAILALVHRRSPCPSLVSVARTGNWASALALFAYAAGFSYAYLALETGTGALILFACVQATMIGWAIARGDRPLVLEWLGLAVAFAAFVWLVSPGIAAPDPLGAALMAAAGIAWGVYSLRGRGSADPLAATAGNFMLAAPVGLLLLVLAFAGWRLSLAGFLLAALSGAVASGMGYALWYTALRQLTATQAAIVQLTVPAIAAAGGIALLGEPLTLRFAASAVAILGGVAVAVTARRRRRG